MMSIDNKNYIIVFFLVVCLCVTMLKTENYAKYIIRVMIDELIPVLHSDNDYDRQIIYELVPSYGAKNVFDDRQYGESENTYCEAYSQNQLSEENGQFYNVEILSSEVPSENDNAPASVEVISPVSPGIVYNMENLLDYDFLLSNCYTVASSTSIYPDEIDANVMLNKDLTIDTSGDNYKVLVYHTHGSEAFCDSREGVLEDTIVGVGDELTRILNDEYGIKTYHDRSVYDMAGGSLDRSMAYTYAGQGIDEILKQYPSIEVILDIHRDGVDESLHLVRIVDGKPTAQIMFFNGVSRSNLNGDIEYLYNPYKLDNLCFSFQMHLKGKELYGDLMRKIYIAGYCYNMDRMPRASLVEIGAQTNTLEEAKNAMIPLARIISEVVTKK